MEYMMYIFVTSNLHDVNRVDVPHLELVNFQFFTGAILFLLDFDSRLICLINNNWIP